MSESGTPPSSLAEFAKHKTDWIEMRVGGQVFETSRETLCADQNSMLAAWILRHLPDENPVLRLDRDARRFEHVLNYLRNGTIWLQDIPSLRAVQEEARFFNLAGLEALCEEHILFIQSKDDFMYTKTLQAFNNWLSESRFGCPDATEPVFRLDEDF